MRHRLARRRRAVVVVCGVLLRRWRAAWRGLIITMTTRRRARWRWIVSWTPATVGWRCVYARGRRCVATSRSRGRQWKWRSLLFNSLNVVRREQTFLAVDPSSPPFWIAFHGHFDDISSAEGKIIRVLLRKVGKSVANHHNNHNVRCSPAHARYSPTMP